MSPGQGCQEHLISLFNESGDTEDKTDHLD